MGNFAGSGIPESRLSFVRSKWFTPIGTGRRSTSSFKPRVDRRVQYHYGVFIARALTYQLEIARGIGILMRFGVPGPPPEKNQAKMAIERITAMVKMS